MMNPDDYHPWSDSGDCQPNQPPTADPGWVHDPVTHSWTKVDAVYPPPAQPTVRPHVRVEEMDEEERARIWNLIKEVCR